MFYNLPPDWKDLLKAEFSKPYFETLSQSVERAYQQQTVFPPAEMVFNALHFCPFNSVKVIIIGQDPYHAPGQAHGLSFSVTPGTKQPPSLKNIF